MSTVVKTMKVAILSAAVAMAAVSVWAGTEFANGSIYGHIRMWMPILLALLPFRQTLLVQ